MVEIRNYLRAEYDQPDLLQMRLDNCGEERLSQNGMQRLRYAAMLFLCVLTLEREGVLIDLRAHGRRHYADMGLC